MNILVKLMVVSCLLFTFAAEAVALSSQLFEVKLVVDEATATKNPGKYQKVSMNTTGTQHEELWVANQPELALDCVADAALVSRKKMPEADVAQYIKDHPDADAQALREWVGTDSAPELQIVLNERGAAKLAELTKKHLKKRIAIMLEGRVVMAPRVVEPIIGGKLSLPGGSAEEVQMMAEKIRKKSCQS